MAWFDSIVARSLVRDEQGHTIYFPYGGKLGFGKGYRLPNAQAEVHVRHFMKRQLLVLFLALFAGGVIQGLLSNEAPPYALFGLILAMLAWYFLSAKRLVAQWPVSSHRLGWAERTRGEAMARSFWSLWFTFAITLPVLALGLWQGIMGDSIGDRLLGVLLALMMVASAGYSLWLIRIKSQR